MGIGTSLGAYYDDAFHQAAAQWDPKYDDNIITPGQVDQNRQMDTIEQNELGGTPIADVVPLRSPANDNTPQEKTPFSDFLSLSNELFPRILPALTIVPKDK